MRANFVEILSRIRLNLTNVEQFIGNACSLADDNPTISRDIHEAAREIRSSALLIDHLRSLFAHQQTIDWRQQLLGGRPLQATGARGHTNDNLGYFSYANQQTLIKAAKCLVANVAKILYLTDEIVLKAHQDATDQQQQQQQHQRQQSSVPYGSSYGQKLQAPDLETTSHGGRLMGHVFQPAAAPNEPSMTTQHHRRHQDNIEANLEKVSGL